MIPLLGLFWIWLAEHWGSLGFSKYFTQILFYRSLINIFAVLILFIQFKMRSRWLEADASWRADTVSLLEPQIQIQVFSSQELHFRELVQSSPQMSKQILFFFLQFRQTYLSLCPIYGYWRNLFPMIFSHTKSNLCGIPRNDMDLIAVRDGCTFTGQIKYCGHSGGLSIINI